MRTLLSTLLLATAACGVGAYFALRAEPDDVALLAADEVDALEPVSIGRVPALPPLAAVADDRAPRASAAARWAKRNNDAAILLGDGQLEAAVAAFAECVGAQPSNDIYRGNLGEALMRLARRQYDERELDLALETFDRALPLLATRDDSDALRELRARWEDERDVESNHWTEGSDLFELSYDTDREDILHHSQRVLDHLEHEYDALRAWFAADPVREKKSERIRVVLYRRSDFGRLTGLGDWAGGAFDGVVRIPVEDLVAEEGRWQLVVTHELVHAFVHALAGPTVPGWLNEGLAQFLERRDGDARARATQRAKARLGTTRYGLERLQGSLATWDDADAIGRAYAQSLLLVQRIATDYGDEALRRMVLDCARSVAPDVTFEEWTNVPLEFVLERLDD